MFMCSKPAGIWTFGSKAVDSGKVKFIKNGIETEKFVYNDQIRILKRKELGLNNKLVVGHVGRFMQQKNHTFLIDIFQELHKKQPNSVLVLVSDGKLMNEVKNKVHTYGLDDAVLFLGNRNDVNELMQAFDVFVFPSLWEGLPLTGIEAQTAGLPVFMSDVITDEVCITNNIYKMSLKQSATEWANKIFSVTNNHKRENMKQQVIDAGFDIRTTADWLQEFYLNAYHQNKL